MTEWHDKDIRDVKDKVERLQALQEGNDVSPLLMTRDVVKKRGQPTIGGSKDANAIVIKFSSFREHKESDKEWRSQGIYTYVRGYLSCLLVYANGSQDVRGTHVSVYVTLMKGKYDDELAWPMCGTIRITLLITRLGQAPSRRVNLSRRYEGLEQNDWSRAEKRLQEVCTSREPIPKANSK